MINMRKKMRRIIQRRLGINSQKAFEKSLLLILTFVGFFGSGKSRSVILTLSGIRVLSTSRCISSLPFTITLISGFFATISLPVTTIST
jgi:hypothetical protein